MMVSPVVGLIAIAAVDTAAPSFNPYDLLAQAPVAAMLILFLMDKVHGPGMKKDRDQARAREDALVDKFLNDVVPTMTKTNELVTKTNEVLERVLRRERGE